MADSPLVERGPSPLLASNNPFRSRVPDNAVSPGLPPTGTVSKNPFLDISELKSADASHNAGDNTVKQPNKTDLTADIFVSKPGFFD